MIDRDEIKRLWNASGEDLLFLESCLCVYLDGGSISDAINKIVQRFECSEEAVREWISQRITSEHDIMRIRPFLGS